MQAESDTLRTRINDASKQLDLQAIQLHTLQQESIKPSKKRQPDDSSLLSIQVTSTEPETKKSNNSVTPTSHNPDISTSQENPPQPDKPTKPGKYTGPPVTFTVQRKTSKLKVHEIILNTTNTKNEDYIMTTELGEEGLFIYTLLPKQPGLSDYLLKNIRSIAEQINKLDEKNPY